MRRHGLRARQLRGRVGRFLLWAQETAYNKGGPCFCHSRPGGFGLCPACTSMVVYAELAGGGAK